MLTHGGRLANPSNARVYVYVPECLNVHHMYADKGAQEAQRGVWAPQTGITRLSETTKNGYWELNLDFLQENKCS